MLRRSRPLSPLDRRSELRETGLVSRLGTLALLVAAVGCSGADRPAPGVEGAAAPMSPIQPGSGASLADGGTGTSVAPGQQDPANPWEVVAKELLRPTWLHVDAQSFYWVSEATGDGAIMKLARTGGAPVKLAHGLVQPDSLQVDDTSAFWLGYGTHAGIQKVSLAGGDVEDLVPVSAPVPIRQTAIDDGHVYYTNAASGSVGRVDKHGGDGKTLASGLSGPVAIAVDSSGVYVAESGDDGAIVRVLHSGGGGTARIATHRPGPHGIVLTDTDILWIDDGVWDVAKSATVGGAIVRLSKAGGSAPQQLAAAEGASALLVDGGYAYYTVAGSVMRVSLSGGVATAVASKQHEPRSLAVDAKYIYWTTLGTPEKGYADGEVRRLPK
jgi:hypothetical protein